MATIGKVASRATSGSGRLRAALRPGSGQVPAAKPRNRIAGLVLASTPVRNRVARIIPAPEVRPALRSRIAAESLRNNRLRSVPARQSPPGDPLAARLGPEPRSEAEHFCSTSEPIAERAAPAHRRLPAAPFDPHAYFPAIAEAPTAAEIRPVALVGDCVAGCDGAWDAFVRRYAPLILAIARRSLRARGMTPAPDDLEDICENTFLALVKDDFSLLRSYDDKYALSTFLGVVARTQAGRFARRRRMGGSDVDVAELPSRCDDPAVAVEEGDLRAALRETLGAMPDRDRQILQLFYFSDRDYREIAAELRISANSVGAALHRARERLKARLEARDRRGALARA